MMCPRALPGAQFSLIASSMTWMKGDKEASSNLKMTRNWEE